VDSGDHGSKTNTMKNTKNISVAAIVMIIKKMMVSRNLF
jgi:hypothetical protein